MFTGAPGNPPASAPTLGQAGPILPHPATTLIRFVCTVSLGVALLACTPVELDPEDLTPQEELSNQAVTVQIVSFVEWSSQLDPSNVTTGVVIPDYDESPRYGVGYRVQAGGAAALSTYWHEDRRRHPGRTLIVGVGDSFGISPPLSSFFEERPAILALNAMGVDYDTFGNHNFDHGLPHLQKMIDLADYRYVIANLTSVPQNMRSVAPFALHDLGGLPVAIIGVLDTEAPNLVFPGSFGTMTVTAPVPAFLETYALAKDMGARAFIVLAHLWAVEKQGVLSGPLIDFTQAIAHLDGVLAVFGEAGDNPRLCQVTADALDCFTVPYDQLDHHYPIPTQSGVPLVQNRSRGRTYTRLLAEVVPATGELQQSHIEFVVPEVSRVEADPAIVAILQPFREALDQVKGERIATIEGSFVVEDSLIRTRELPAGNLVADAMLAYSTTDIAVINSGGFRSSLPASSYIPQDPSLRRPPADPPWDLLRGDIDAMLPFVNFIVEQSITGAEIWDMLENSVSAIGTQESGIFLQIAGFRFWYDATRPPGSRICAVQLDNDDPVRRDATRYRIATVDFLAQGGDGYFSLTNDQGITRDLLTDVIIKYIRDRQSIGPDAYVSDPPRINRADGDTSLCP